MFVLTPCYKNVITTVLHKDFEMCYILTDASEAAQARLKGLDQAGPQVSMNVKPPKDVNTFINNQVKHTPGPVVIPADQMKCNILKAKRDEEMKKSTEGIRGKHNIYSAIFLNPFPHTTILQQTTLNIFCVTSD